MSPRAKSLPRRAAAEQVTLEFADNKLVAALSGPHQKHFARIEQRLSVLITQRGNLIGVAGTAETRARAAAILRALYARLEAGESITLAEVDAELRFTDPDINNSRAATEGAIRTSTSRITRPRSPAQAAYLDLMRQNPLVFGIGPAGTGKTYLAAAFAAHMLHQRRVERLILSRPALEAGERLGFLPGDLKEKIDPYLRPLYDALFDVLGEQTTRLMEQGVIEVAPLAFMRGRTLTRAFVILDEAQNTTAGPDEDGADPAGRREPDGGDRRSVPMRSAGKRRLWPERGALHSGRCGRRGRCAIWRRRCGAPCPRQPHRRRL